VINLKAAKRFAEAMQTRTKTDPSMPQCWLSSPSACPYVLAAPRRPGPGHPCLCPRHHPALNKLRTQTKNQLHAAQSTAMTPDFLIASLSLYHSIAHFDTQIEHLRRQTPST